MSSVFKVRASVFIWAVIFLLILTFILPYQRMNLMSYLVILIGASLLLISHILTKDMCSPQFILCATWTLSLYLASLDIRFVGHLEHFNDPLNTTTWLGIFSFIAIFFLGSTFAMYPLRSSDREKVGSYKLHWGEGHIRRLSLFSFLISITVFIYAILKSGGVPVLSEDVNTAREQFIPGSIGVLLILFQLCVILAAMKIAIHGIWKSRLEISIALVSLVCIFSTTQRIGAIESVLMSVFVFFVIWPYTDQRTRKKRKKILTLFGGGGLALFLWGFFFIAQERGLAKEPLTDLTNFVQEQLFVYFGGPAPKNLQMAMEGGIFYEEERTTYGALFVRPILWFSGARDAVNVDDVFRGPNNATALFHYYLDFGIFGFFIFSFIWGSICGYIYGYFRRTLNFHAGIIYSILATATYFLPLSERFSEVSTFLKIVLFISVSLLLLWLSKLLPVIKRTQGRVVE